MLAEWLETEISETSEDNESNTSPQDQNGSCSSPVLTSNETDDSCDGHGKGGREEDMSCNADASSSTDSEIGSKLGDVSPVVTQETGAKDVGGEEEKSSLLKPEERAALASQLVHR